PPAVLRERVLIDDPVAGLPLRALARHVADDRDAGAVVADTLIAPGDNVGPGAVHEHDPRVSLFRQVRRGVGCLWVAVEGRLVVDQHRTVGAAHPKPVAAMVGGVAFEGVAGAPALESVVVPVRTIVAYEAVAGGDPAVEAAEEDAVAAVGARVVGEG